MKHGGFCAKCRSGGIIRIPGAKTPHGAGGNIPLPRKKGHILDPEPIRVTRYVCAACGYSEEWIERPEDIDALQEAFGDK
jgi:hypothetical protein